MNDWTAEDGAIVQEFPVDKFAELLGLPPGATVTATAVAWETLAVRSDVVRVCFRPGPLTVVPDAEAREPLNSRLRKLAAKWNSQARHPQRRFKPEEAALLTKHASELLGELDLEKGPGT